MNTQNEEYLTPEAMEEQEHLSLQRLKNLAVTRDLAIDENSRPPANFIELMNWVENNFKVVLKDGNNLNKFVHNRVIIDGQFLHFCEINGVKVECLYKDSAISWKTEHGF